MASPSSVPQLLINAGELGEILRIIKIAKNPELKIVGNLFGLWRNSCNQPVVQLVTGPGKRAKISKKTYSPDGVYHIGMKLYLEAQHGLLQIGLWCSGNSSRYPALNAGNPNYNLHNALMPEKGRYVVLMFVDRTPGNLEIEYQIIDREGLEPSRIASLAPEDVLPGASSFRLLEPVFEQINYGVKFPSQRDQYSCYFSTNMLSTNNNRSPAKITSTNGDITPANGNITPANDNITPVNGNISPANGNITPANGNISPANGNITPANGNITPANGNISPTKTADIPTTMEQPSSDWSESDASDSSTKKLAEGFKSTTYL